MTVLYSPYGSNLILTNISGIKYQMRVYNSWFFKTLELDEKKIIMTLN